jgi:RNA polymerase sigma-70 factor (ECF subfamily)
VPNPKKSQLLQLLDLFSVSSKDEDYSLMEKLQKGDLNAFERLYMKYRIPLYSYFLGQAHSPSHAEEFLQDTFSKVIEHKDSFKFESKFSTWLWSIARNIMIDYWRSSGHQLHKLTINGEFSETELATLESPLTNDETQLIEKSEDQALKDCMDELSHQQKESILLRIHSDLSYEEIAKGLELTIPSVKSLIVRAKQKLINCLKRGGHHER